MDYEEELEEQYNAINKYQEKIQDDVNWLVYSFEKVFKILFYKPQQDLQIECLDNIYNTIDMEELQAIYNKCKEIGWLDE